LGAKVYSVGRAGEDKNTLLIQCGG
jgi:hypothetical protein